MLEEYVSRVEEACGEGRDFVVILKYAKREEAMRKVLEKCEVKHRLSGVFTRCDYKGKEISIFATGKLILKGIYGREAAEELLREILQ